MLCLNWLATIKVNIIALVRALSGGLSRVMVCLSRHCPALSRKFSRPIPPAKSQNSRSAPLIIRRKKTRLVRSGFLHSGSQTSEDTSSVDA